MTGLIDAFTGDFKVSKKASEVIIAPLDRYGKIDSDLGGAKVLQYWPESLTDSENSNWQAKDIPGSPRPLYQWISGGERPLSFTTLFSRDMDGEIGVDFEEDKHNVDIDAAIAWLKLLKSSDYEAVQDMNMAVAPPVLWLQFSGTKLGYNHAAPQAGNYTLESGVYCILESVEPEYRSWFPSGTPRLASCALAFKEVIQVGSGVYPFGRDLLKWLASNYTRTPSE